MTNEFWCVCSRHRLCFLQARASKVVCNKQNNHCNKGVFILQQRNYWINHMECTTYVQLFTFISHWRNSPQWVRASSLPRLHDHTTVGMTPLEEWSARRRDLYLTTHNTHKRQTSMQAAGFEPASPESDRSQTHALDCAATEIGKFTYLRQFIIYLFIYLFIYLLYSIRILKFKICEHNNNTIKVGLHWGQDGDLRFSGTGRKGVTV
jgi:hypothetical protein